MRIIAFIMIGLMLLTMFSWWNIEDMPNHQIGQLSVLAEDFLEFAEKRDYEQVNIQLSLIKQALQQIPSYAFPKEELPEQLEVLIYLTERDLWSVPSESDDFWEHALSLYYTLDALAHPYQPQWLHSLQAKRLKWKNRDVEMTLKEYTLLRPAMSVSLDKKTVDQFDRFFTSVHERKPDQLDQLIQVAKYQQEKNHLQKSIQTLLLVLLVLLIGLGYVAWQKRKAT